MVGSFEIFRKYQRSLLVIVAILAMLAFFVLPPFLQMGSQVGGQDPVAVRWKGGELREGGLERAVAIRSVVNRFLAEAAALGGRGPTRQFLPEQEEQTVQTMLLAQDAKDNGIVVSDRAVNDFLAQWTGNLVRPEQLADLLSRLRVGPLAVSEQEVFEVLRTELAAQTMLMLHQPAFGGTPPGWRWDHFRRLDQQAKVELVPVVVETFANQVPAPNESQLRDLYEKHKNSLPEARSSAPGFREPHRVQYEYLVAKRGVFDEEATKEVTDEQISEYYEKNKVAMFRAKPAAEQPPAKPADAADDPAQFEPLEKVKDEIRKRLAQTRADARIDAIFTNVASDVASYSEDYALWQARRPSGVEAPRPPDLAKIAEKQGLEWGRSELIAANAAVAGGGIGSSFERFSDPANPFGFRSWLEQMYGTNTMSLRPITSRDVEGNRYLSWKTEDQPEFTPSFETARADVERSWRIIEARGLARRRAEEIARQAQSKNQTLATTVQDLAKDNAGGHAGMQATEVGPFAWFAQDAVSAGGPPRMSDPDGVSMPGEEFMRSVFSLEPNGTSVAFNEPQTVCYAIRMVSQEPSPEQLRERFATARGDRQRTAMLEQNDMTKSFRATIDQMQKRRGLEWKRQPRGVDR